MKIRTFVYKLHLVLGLISGIVVFVVAITGCLYAFKSEIEDFTQPYRKVAVEQAPYLPPSELNAQAETIFPNKVPFRIVYHNQGKAAEILYYQTAPLFYQGIFLNPYSGEVIKVKDYTRDFFQIVLMGHFQLWLPRSVGQPIVSVSVLVFLVLLITGTILWWPKRGEARKRFRINWKNPWQRRFYDLHSVLGFYAQFVLVIIAITGLVWGFEWVANGLYKVTGGEKEQIVAAPVSKVPENLPDRELPAIDAVWYQLMEEYPEAATMEMHIPHTAQSAIYARINPDEETLWKSDYRYFNQHTLEELEVDAVWGKFENASVPDKIRRMNYDVHIGAIGGLTGKIIAFFASLVAASLPVTGFILWQRRRKEKKKLKAKLEL